MQFIFLKFTEYLQEQKYIFTLLSANISIIKGGEKKKLTNRQKIVRDTDRSFLDLDSG